jgi:hypothetical protein
MCTLNALQHVIYTETRCRALLLLGLFIAMFAWMKQLLVGGSDYCLGRFVLISSRRTSLLTMA